MEENVRSLRVGYVTLAGEELEIPRGKALQYLERVRQAAENHSVDVDGITALVWSVANPLMMPSPVSGAAMATRETYEHQAFRAMLDCISRKRIATGDLDLSAAAQKYTVPVPDAAQQLGIHESSVRKAIASGRLSAWKRGGAYFLDPASVSAYQVSIRGAKAMPQMTAVPVAPPGPEEPTTIHSGTRGGHTLLVKYKGPAAEHHQAADGEIRAVLPAAWKRIAVLTGNKNTGKYWLQVLSHEPDGEVNTLRYGGFEVRGRFLQEALKRDRSRDVLAQWEAFQPE